MHKSSSHNIPPVLADHDLLRRFVLDADESAFEEIVRRYQRLVMSVSRRVTGERADAEDAFQAVFVALARRPRSIRRETSLSSWLYTVAWRTSLRLVRRRRMQSMEPLTHSEPSEDPDPLDQIAADQNSDVLHAELNLLPDRYRQVLVMTYFADQTSQQIADQLQLTKGAVDGRIRQARNMLRVRLARRSISLSVLTAMSSTLHSSATASAVTPRLLESTIQLGTQTLSNSVPGTADLSHLEPLMRPEITVMNVKFAAVFGTCLAVVVGAVGMAQLDDGAGASDVIEGVPSAIDTATTVVELAPDIAATVVAPGRAVASNIDEQGFLPATSGEEIPNTFATSALGGVPPSITDPRDRWLHEMMSQPSPRLDYRGETSLGDVLEFLAEHYTETFGSKDGQDHRMTIWIDQLEFMEEGISSIDEVLISDIDLQGIRMRSALELIFEQTGMLTWDIHDGVLEVTTNEKLETDPKHRVSRMYTVATISNLEDLIRDHLRTQEIYFQTENPSDDNEDASSGALTVVEGRLIVTHHRRAQEAVAKFLETLGVLASSHRERSADRNRDSISAAAGASGYIPFDSPILVNLNGERMTRYLRMEFGLKINPKLANLTRKRLDLYSIALKDWLISHLAEKSLEDVRGRNGQEQIRREIREHFTSTLFPEGDKELKDVLFLEFAVQ